MRGVRPYDIGRVDPEWHSGVDDEFDAPGYEPMRLECWTLRALDGGRYEARLYVNGERSGASLLASSLDRLRGNLPPTLARFPAGPGDPPDVLEHWI